MKNVVIGAVMLLALTRCNDTGLETPNAELLIGSWENTTTGNVITFDANNNYTVTFNADTAFTCKYRLGTSTDKHTLYVYDTVIIHECAFQFLEDNQLAMTLLRRLDEPYFSDAEKNTGTYRRLK